MLHPTRILFLAGSLVGGGSERQIVEILRLLNRSRFDPLLYVVYREGELLREVPEDVPIYSYWDRHEFPRLNFPGRILRRQSRDLANVLAREKVDLICDRNFHMTLLSAATCRLRPTPRISIVSSDPVRDLPASSRRFLMLKRAFLRRAYRTASRVVAVSNGVRESVRRYYHLPEGNLVTIFNLIDFSHIDRLATEFEPPMLEDRFHIVNVGRLEPEKGLHVLVDAMNELVHRRRLTTLCLWIIGQGSLEKELRTLIRERRLDDHIRLTGYQPNPLPYVKRAELFCLSSLYEGMPNVLGEAMACGTPVLASDCRSGPREMLDDGRLGRLVPPGDPSALADGIEEAWRNYDQWRRLTPLARTHLESHFSAETGMAKYESLFASVRARGGALARAARLQATMSR